MKLRMAVASLVTALIFAVPVSAKDTDGHLQAADELGRAMTAADTAKIKALLAPDVLIYEFGGQETSFDEYAATHMRADIEFMAKVAGTVVDRKHDAAGDLAWVATRRRMIGSYQEKPIDVFSTETLVLRRGPAGWKIVHIQWSSQPATPPKK
ncbi:MAG: YybH family protein [Gammaproteobacteria bacterium]